MNLNSLQFFLISIDIEIRFLGNTGIIFLFIQCFLLFYQCFCSMLINVFVRSINESAYPTIFKISIDIEIHFLGNTRIIFLFVAPQTEDFVLHERPFPGFGHGHPLPRGALAVGAGLCGPLVQRDGPSLTLAALEEPLDGFHAFHQMALFFAELALHDCLVLARIANNSTDRHLHHRSHLLFQHFFLFQLIVIFFHGDVFLGIQQIAVLGSFLYHFFYLFFIQVNWAQWRPAPKLLSSIFFSARTIFLVAFILVRSFPQPFFDFFFVVGVHSFVLVAHHIFLSGLQSFSFSLQDGEGLCLGWVKRLVRLGGNFQFDVLPRQQPSPQLGQRRLGGSQIGTLESVSLLRAKQNIC